MAGEPMRIYRQGDVLVREVAELPLLVRPVERDAGRIVLAYGEATGHAHVIDAPPEEATLLSASEERRFLQLVAPVRLTHEEHAAIELPAGLYEVVRQRVWTDADADEARRQWEYVYD